MSKPQCEMCNDDTSECSWCETNKVSALRARVKELEAAASLPLMYLCKCGATWQEGQQRPCNHGEIGNKRLREVLSSIAADGCIVNSKVDDSDSCRNVETDRDDWCYGCLVADALDEHDLNEEHTK